LDAGIVQQLVGRLPIDLAGLGICAVAAAQLFRHHQPANIELIEGEPAGDDTSTEDDTQ
jgi:hypothetical protein